MKGPRRQQAADETQKGFDQERQRTRILRDAGD